MKIKKHQMGGAMEASAPEAAPAADPIEEIVMMMQQGLQNSDCAMLAEACSAFISMIAAESQPQPIGSEPQQPVFRKGGTISRKR